MVTRSARQPALPQTVRSTPRRPGPSFATPRGPGTGRLLSPGTRSRSGAALAGMTVPLEQGRVAVSCGRGIPHGTKGRSMPGRNAVQRRWPTLSVYGRDQFGTHRRSRGRPWSSAARVTEALRDGVAARLGGPLQRAVLADLALSPPARSGISCRRPLGHVAAGVGDLHDAHLRLEAGRVLTGIGCPDILVTAGRVTASTLLV